MVFRRAVLGGVGVSLAGAVGLGTVTAQRTGTENETDLPIYITNVDERAETFAIENLGSDAVDLSNYAIDLEHDQPDNQTRALPEGTVIRPDVSITVASGATDATADVTLGYGSHQINNSDPDTIALLSPDGELVRTSAERPPARTGGSGDGSDADSDADSGTDSDSDAGSGSTSTDDSQRRRERTDTETPADSGTGSNSDSSDSRSDQRRQSSSSTSPSACSGSPDCPPPEPPEDC